MKVAWVGTFEPDFSRNHKLARLLDIAGAETSVMHESLWPPDRIGLAGGGMWRVILRSIWIYPKLVFRTLLAPAPDVYLVSYPGWFDVPVVWLVSRIKGRPLVFDPFISLHDTMVSDRSLRPSRSLKARVAVLADRWSLRLADVVLADTEPDLRFYDAISPGVATRGHVLPVGADDAVFTPEDGAASEPDRVLFYGSFVPLQGVTTIAEAAAIVSGDGIGFAVIGDGQDRTALDAVIARTGVDIERIGPIPLDELPDHISRATVCLGIFGVSDKAGRVVPHKLYECLAMGRPVVTRDGPGIRSLFTEDEVMLVPPGDPQALAQAVRSLCADSDLRERLGSSGHAAYVERYQEAPLAERLATAFRSVVE